MRAFVAIEVPEKVKRELRGRIAIGKEKLPKARWVNPDLLHITLVFLGETEESDLVTLDHELGGIFARRQAFDIGLSGGGTFPPRGSAKVAWAGVRPDRDLEDLQKEVARSISLVLGKSAEARPFHAHVTLARCRQPWKRYAVTRYDEMMHDFASRFRVEGGVLMASELGQAGPRYNRVATWPLGGS